MHGAAVKENIENQFLRKYIQKSEKEGKNQNFFFFFFLKQILP